MANVIKNCKSLSKHFRLELYWNNYGLSVPQYRYVNHLFLALTKCNISCRPIYIVFFKTICVNFYKHIRCFNSSKIRQTIWNNL